MSIELTKYEDFEEVYALLLACKDRLIDQGIFQWDEEYPNSDHVKGDIANGSLVKYVLENKLAGVISFDNCQEPEYNFVHWKYNSGSIAVVHRLAVHPTLQGQGLASKLMAFAEKTIAEKGFYSIRLDAYSGNSMLLEYYKKLGYQKAGEIYFPSRDLPFICFEKQVKI